MNSFGHALRVQLYGQSHGDEIGCILDGVPPGIPFDAALLEARMAARRPGTPWSSARREPDRVVARSGVHNGHTTGDPLLLAIANRDVRSQDYDALESTPRPGHGDWTQRAWSRGNADLRGGGHRSGRLTAPLVAAGAVAEMLGRKANPAWSVAAALTRAGTWAAPTPVGDAAAWLSGFDGPWVHPDHRSDFIDYIQQVRRAKDAVGAEVQWRADGIPALLGNPTFASATAHIGALLLAIPGVKGAGFGHGFSAARMRASEHNDNFRDDDGVRPATNNAGGVLGGRTTGLALTGQVAFKPTPSIASTQATVDYDGNAVALNVLGRHDPCIGVRGAPVVAACVHLALADLLLHENGVQAFVA